VDAGIDRRAAAKRCGVGAAVRSGRRQLASHLPKEMVDRERIELPTPGFSGLAIDFRKCPEVREVPSEVDPMIMGRNEPE